MPFSCAIVRVCAECRRRRTRRARASRSTRWAISLASAPPSSSARSSRGPTRRRPSPTASASSPGGVLTMAHPLHPFTLLLHWACAVVAQHNICPRKGLATQPFSPSTRSRSTLLSVATSQRVRIVHLPPPASTHSAYSAHSAHMEDSTARPAAPFHTSTPLSTSAFLLAAEILTHRRSAASSTPVPLLRLICASKWTTGATSLLVAGVPMPRLGPKAQADLRCILEVNGITKELHLRTRPIAMIF
eukprot:6174241-Pleurochrysis_carterae.AAC.1